jgi:hypothetical protein
MMRHNILDILHLTSTYFLSINAIERKNKNEEVSECIHAFVRA